MRARASPPDGERFVSISSGGVFTCALRSDGSLLCWGRNEFGQVSVSNAERFVSLSSGFGHTCALRPDGSPVCWGLNDEDQASPPAGERFASVSSGAAHTCALRPDGSAVCWGRDELGQASPPIGERFTSIISGLPHTCALRPDGSVFCWGLVVGGELPSQEERFRPSVGIGSTYADCALTAALSVGGILIVEGLHRQQVSNLHPSVVERSTHVLSA